MSVLFKNYNLQKGNLYMKPALLDIFEMPKDRDCKLYKKHYISFHRQKFVNACSFKQFEILLPFFTDKLYT